MKRLKKYHMSFDMKSPKITNIAWGKVKIEGFDKIFKDVKLYPGGAKEWDWNETGTRHIPGIQPADIKELVKNDSEIIILSRGVFKRLKTSDEAIAFLVEKNINYEILQTPKAAELYNHLCDENKKVGALIHSTC